MRHTRVEKVLDLFSAVAAQRKRVGLHRTIQFRLEEHSAGLHVRPKLFHRNIRQRLVSLSVGTNVYRDRQRPHLVDPERPNWFSGILTEILKYRERSFALGTRMRSKTIGDLVTNVCLCSQALYTPIVRKNSATAR